MPAKIVKQPNGLYARFSTIVDTFTHYDMDEWDLVEMFTENGGLKEGRRQIHKANSDPDAFAECIETVRLVHGKQAANNLMRKICPSKP